MQNGKKVPGRCKRGTVKVKNCPLSIGTGPPGWSCSDFSAYWNSAPAKLVFRTFTNLCFGTRSGTVQGVILCRGSGGWSFTVENWWYFAFPDNLGFLLNHIWTKTLRSGDKHVFIFKRGTNKMVCPLGGLELYVRIWGLLGIELGSGYLFRPVSKTGTVSSQCITSRAA